uniref:hypothetical protein n=1 Tax=Sphingomonas sp. TaxID=28214 RepID=UPI0025FE968B|nr:hypothetical protein [Sphingomonas sp.]
MSSPGKLTDLIIGIGAARAEGRYHEAERFCRDAINLEPKNATLRVLLGWIALDRKGYDDAILAARQAGDMADHDAVAVARLLVYAAAAGGDWAIADATLSALDDATARALAVETGPIFLACLQEFRRNEAWEGAVRSFSHVPHVLDVAAPNVMRDLCAIASTCYLALGRAEAAIALFGRAAMLESAELEVSREDRPPLLVTSLMPARFEVQKAAVASWRRLGFNVASLNSADEIDTLRSEFPDMTFHTARRDAKELFGRPLIYVDEMLELLSGNACRIGGIINSDIVFAADAEAVVIRALALAEHALIFGNRVNVERLDVDAATSEIYLFGYDWFLFRTGRAAQIAGGGMVFGAPWWDLWLPLQARSLGFDIVNVREPVALHEIHALHWRQHDLEKMGRILADTLIARATDAAIDSFGDRVAQLGAILTRAGPETLADRFFLDWLASLLRGLVQLDAIPFTADACYRTGPFWNSQGEI